MIRLLQIEFIKLWNNKISRILILSYFILLCCIAMVSIIEFPIDQGISLANMGIFNFPYIWHFNTWFAAIFKLFMAIVIVSMMANEYSNKTLKQNLIDGLSKREFILSKFLTVVSFSAVSTVFVFLVSLILGLFYSSYNEVSIIFSELEFLLAFFIKLIGFFSFCLFLGILVKRSAFSLGFLILWWILEQILYGTLGLMFSNWDLARSIKNFFPLESMQNLIKNPIKRLDEIRTIGELVGADFSNDYHVHWNECLIVILWTTLFIYFSYALLKKRDL